MGRKRHYDEDPEDDNSEWEIVYEAEEVWNQGDSESDEDYQDRMNDLADYAEYFD